MKYTPYNIMYAHDYLFSEKKFEDDRNASLMFNKHNINRKM